MQSAIPVRQMFGVNGAAKPCSCTLVARTHRIDCKRQVSNLEPPVHQAHGTCYAGGLMQLTVASDTSIAPRTRMAINAEISYIRNADIKVGLILLEYVRVSSTGSLVDPCSISLTVLLALVLLETCDNWYSLSDDLLVEECQRDRKEGENQ
ncbi:hypothetical protein N7540_001074 [Penicillium herquei]|nr:hypothetical protein N7540_001074 [Penicillium herquei]